MTQTVLNQAWEDVADDVTSAIEKAVQPLLKKAVDDIYSGLLDATQDYLKDNLAFNIASRISSAEREASGARQRMASMALFHDDMLLALHQYRNDMIYPVADDSKLRRIEMIDALIKKAGVK